MYTTKCKVCNVDPKYYCGNICCPQRKQIEYKFGNQQLKWDRHFIRIAREVASISKDPSTKVGVVLVKNRRIIGTGYNGFPEGIADTPERLNDRPTKYKLMLHAEENAIANCIVAPSGRCNLISMAWSMSL